MNVFRRAQIRKDDWVAIVGTGFLGTILLQLCAEAGAKVIAISRRRSALQLAEKMGAHLTLSLENQAKLLEAVRNATRQQLCQVVIEAGGAQETLDIASALTATRGPGFCLGVELSVSVDTMVAHLAGALGKKVYVLLHADADWRWLKDRNDSPWYPTMKLLRQSHAGDWRPVVNGLVGNLISDCRDLAGNYG